ncbi:hypothetical protein BJ322DRAFT_489434 [Thelephora terrestris]|uniref:Uncharacterized protein n=1 Tax=Thelephora terrestris TaxID=56493 RepID=A0A9P6L1Z1_9AGAM|nr:hypothetical protein BJ322DRAFT_489434 [Thelephora terrestris]
MGEDAFILFLRLRALRKDGDCVVDAESQFGQGGAHVQSHEADPNFLGEAVTSAILIPEYTLLQRISMNVKVCSDRDGGWRDEAVYGGLVAIRDICRLGPCLPEVGFLQTLAEAMEEDKPFSVRKVAYDVLQAARDDWLRSVVLRQTLWRLDLPRRLYSVAIQTGRADHQLSFLKIVEILSEDEYWHSYLRGSMDIWLDCRHEGPHQAIQILLRIGKIPPPEDGHHLQIDDLLVKIVADEWARVPGRQAKDISADLLKPFVEVTMQLKESFFSESDRQAVLAVVEQVIPSLEKRQNFAYEGPGKVVSAMVSGLLCALRISTV